MTQAEKQSTPFGQWPSPFSARAIAQAGRRLAQPQCEAHGIYWLEGRPEEGGRSVLCRWREGVVESLTPQGYSIRSRAQEYGGGAWCAVDAQTRYFIEDSDQGLYRQDPQGIHPLRVDADARFADLQWDPAHQRILAVREVDSPDADEPRAELVAIDTQGRLHGLAQGADFYTAPRPHPKGDRLAWLEWDHPDMPWDRTRLMMARLDERGQVTGVEEIAGERAESLFQPEWGQDGSLYFVSDRQEGWWNLHRWEGDTVQAVYPDAAEFGLPYWQFNMRSWGFCNDESILAARSSAGLWSLVHIADDQCRTLDTAWSSIQHLHCAHGQAVMLAGRADHPLAVVRIDPERGPVEVLASAAEAPQDTAAISQPQALSFPTSDQEQAHALFYPPNNPSHQGPAEQRPPLLVKCHGGPTGATDTAFDPRIQFWTSRGIAVVDVNYRGSTGYGRAYRHRLYGGWGQLDVADCAAVVGYLAEQDRVDPARCLISGSSAGGYTVLAALTFSDVFAAGASHYGIGDLFALDATTHKMESRYTEKLVGPKSTMKAEWQARSPLYQAEQLQVPVIFFQGDQDKVVPPEQAQAMADVLRQRGIPVSHVLFQGEGHGFRRAEHIEAALNMELAFYARILGFQPPESLPDPEIENL